MATTPVFLPFLAHHARPLLLYFALSFWIEGANRFGLGLVPEASELNPVFYGLRIVAYGLIILAIWQKNQPRS